MGCAENKYTYIRFIDVNSRWAYAEASAYIGAARSSEFIKNAVEKAPFAFSTVQSDHGSEFSKFFIKKLTEPELNIKHRYTRIRKPNDNAHIERFNRTIQEECTLRISRDLIKWEKEVPEYIHYYNNERPHMSLDWLTPAEKLEQVTK